MGRRDRVVDPASLPWAIGDLRPPTARDFAHDKRDGIAPQARLEKFWDEDYPAACQADQQMMDRLTGEWDTPGFDLDLRNRLVNYHCALAERLRESWVVQPGVAAAAIDRPELTPRDKVRLAGALRRSAYVLIPKRAACNGRVRALPAGTGGRKRSSHALSRGHRRTSASRDGPDDDSAGSDGEPPLAGRRPLRGRRCGHLRHVSHAIALLLMELQP